MHLGELAIQVIRKADVGLPIDEVLEGGVELHCVTARVMLAGFEFWVTGSHPIDGAVVTKSLRFGENVFQQQVTELTKNVPLWNRKTRWGATKLGHCYQLP